MPPSSSSSSDPEPPDPAGPGPGPEPEPARLDGEVTRLRAELLTSRAISARALARATRLAQLVSALGQLTDVPDLMQRAVCEVAEQFDTDIAAVLTPAGEGVRLTAHWGIATRHRPAGVLPRPSEVERLTSLLPVLAGPVAEYPAPDWMLVSRPLHLAWGLLTVRQQTLGFLLLARRGDEPFDQAEVQELGAVVGRIALAVDNGQLYRATQEQLQRFRRLHELTAALAGHVDLERAVEGVVETLVAEVPVGGAALYLSRDPGLTLAGLAGSLAAPRHLPEAGPGRPELTTLPLGAGDTPLGALLLSGAPAPGGEAHSFLQHLADISGLVLEKALLFDRIRTQAETDALTGLPNRLLVMDRLSTALARCRPDGADLAVIFLDLDGFKAVNDTHGHGVGDQLLVQVGQRLLGAIRLPDTAARLGGDEFLVLCEDISAPELNAIVVERIQAAVDEPYLLDGPSGSIRVQVGGSLGVGMAKDVGYDASTLLRVADTAMYAAKQRRSLGTALPPDR